MFRSKISHHYKFNHFIITEQQVFESYFREFYTRRKSPPVGKPPADSRDSEKKETNDDSLDDTKDIKEPEKKDSNDDTKDLKYAEGPIPMVNKAESGINVITGRKVVRIDAARQEAELDNGRVITYGKCLLATGGKPKVGAVCNAINFAPK